MVKSFAAVLAVIIIFLVGYITGRDKAVFDHFFSGPVPSMPFEQVLDGDTIVDRGRTIHIAGIDAPELGPWARCLAEAGLAGFSKVSLPPRNVPLSSSIMPPPFAGRQASFSRMSLG